MGETKCKGDHSQHICKLAKEKKLTLIKILVKAPKYLCKKCGCAADKSENLCKPKHINEIE